MTVTTTDSDTWELKYQTDRHPQYWSTPDGTNIYFSSYNASVDTDLYLYQEKTSCYGLIKPTFDLSDGFTPDLEAEYFNWFIEEAKSAASLKLRQVQDPKAEQRARRGWVRSMPNTFTSNNYGRK